MEAANEFNWDKAAEYLDLRNLPADVQEIGGPELARQFNHVLSRTVWLDQYSVSDSPEGLIALVLILLVTLTLGLIWPTRPTRHAAEWLESRSLDHLPIYRIMKSLVGALLDLEDEESFKPGTWRHDDGSLEPIFVIGEHGPDMYMVMQPWTPTPFAGTVKLMPRDQIDLVPVTLDEYSLALTHFGLGLSEALEKGEPRE